jgi:hypothetical protein
MTLNQIIELLRDGRPRKFAHQNLPGFFYKARFPSREQDVRLDGAHSAITWHGEELVMLLDDFDRDDWTAEDCDAHPGAGIRLAR